MPSAGLSSQVVRINQLSNNNRMQVKNILIGSLFLLSLLAQQAQARMDEDVGRAAPPKLTPAQILSGIYQPLTGPLKELEKTFRTGKNYVVWIHVPAQHPLDLRSSELFRRWALATPVVELTISHNMVAFRCMNESGKLQTGATGMTGASNLQEAKALIAGHGLSIFFDTYLDGHLNPQQEVGAYITKNLAKRGAIFGAFEVTQKECGEMQNFLSDFVHHPRRPFERFNNVGDPLKFEGGGCVTFASALLLKAGQLASVIPHFFRDFYAARYLFGGNLGPVQDVEPFATPWLNGERRSISFNLFWNNPWNLEASGFPGSVYLHQIDPEKMVYTLKQFASVYLESQSAEVRARDERWLANSTLGSRVSVGANNLADPGGIMEYTHTTIDDAFDDEMAEVGQAARSWFRERLRSGSHIRLERVVGMPALLLEKN